MPTFLETISALDDADAYIGQLIAERTVLRAKIADLKERIADMAGSN